MGSDHLMTEADSPMAGARVGREKVMREVTRCSVSTSPNSSNSLGNSVMVIIITMFIVMVTEKRGNYR